MLFTQLPVSTQLIVIKDFISYKAHDGIHLTIIQAIELLSQDNTTLYDKIDGSIE